MNIDSGVKRATFAVIAALAALGAAAAQAQGTAYVSSEKDPALTLIDLATLTVKGTLPTCKRGRHIQLTPERQVMVACTDSNAADVIDPASGKSLRRIPLGDEPEAFDISPDGKTIYVSNEDAGEASFVDAQTGKVLKSIKVGQEPEGVKVSADGKTLYVTSEAANLVHVIDVASASVVKNIRVGKRPRRMALTPDGKELWVTNELDASVSIVSTATHGVIGTLKFEVKGARAEEITPVGIQISRDGKRAFVALGKANHVAFVDVPARKVVNLVLVGKRAWNVAALAAGFVPAAQAVTQLKATLIAPEPDARLDRSQLERAFLGHPGGPASDGVQMAIDESRFELQAADTTIALTQQPAGSLEAARAAAQQAEKAGAAVLLTDLPADWTLAVADAVKLPVINLGNAADALRQQDCRSRLFHTLPSERMRADALAQTLVSRKWNKLLLLVGTDAQDQLRAATAQASIKRYGLQVVASKPFKLSADPRERDLANPLLLTAGSAYDAVWVIDSDGEFARSLPYRIALPRPVVGDGGLVALAWHAQFERYGAPQVSRRFAKAAKRPMTANDWAAWMAGKALVAVVTAAPKGPPAAWAQALASAQLDGSKGGSLSFRPWDGQLRQTVLLTDGQGVISQAPIEGLLHPSNVLDTLGADAAEKLCKVAR